LSDESEILTAFITHECYVRDVKFQHVNLVKEKIAYALQISCPPLVAGVPLDIVGRQGAIIKPVQQSWKCGREWEWVCIGM
jgi:hypothetical protein